jgi:hypothetical protein
MRKQMKKYGVEPLNKEQEAKVSDTKKMNSNSAAAG